MNPEKEIGQRWKMPLANTKIQERKGAYLGFYKY